MVVSELRKETSGSGVETRKQQKQDGEFIKMKIIIKFPLFFIKFIVFTIYIK